MDKEKILQSSLLENYVLGTASELEVSMVEQALALYPELGERLNVLESSLEQLAQSQAIEVSQDVKNKIFDSIEKIKANKEITDNGTPQFHSFLHRILQLPIAASFIIGLIISGVAGYFMHIEDQNKIDQLNEQLTTIIERCDEEKVHFAFIDDYRTKKVVMNDLKGSIAIGYWNDTDDKGLLRMINMPLIEEDESYQIWADVHGEMISVGIVNAEDYMENSFASIGFVEEAESLNITIEPKGGSPSPNVERLVMASSI